MNYFFRFVSLLWHVLPPFLIQLYSFILTLQLDQFLGSRSSHHCPESLRDGVEALEVDFNLTSIGEKGQF
jgi:hypothetical protein